MIKTLYRKANKPEPTEKIQNSGTVYWGEDNLYPQFLNGLYYDNSVHGGVINQKVKFITAGGLTVEGADESVLNNDGGVYSWQEIIDNLALDYEIGESFCIHFKKNLLTKVWSASPMDYELIRATEEGVFFDYSENWEQKSQTDKCGYRKIKNIDHVNENDTECLMVVISRPKQRNFVKKKGQKSCGLTSNYYPVVQYSGAITDILASIEMSYFTYSEVVNGFKGGTFISLGNGIPDDQKERQRIIDDLKDEASERDTQGGLAVAFHDGSDRAPIVNQINGNDLDKRYEQTKKSCRDAILISHGVISPALFGVLSESMFGSKEEMETAYLLFQENYVKKRQSVIASSINWALKKLNGFTGKIVMNSYIPEVLKPTIEQPTVMKEEMSKEDIDSYIVAQFGKVGISKDKVKILKSRTFDYSDNDQEFKSEFVNGKFASHLTDDQKTILTMIKNGESYDAISKALGKGGIYLSNQLVTLGNLGLLDGWELTEKGTQNTVTETELEVLYSYEKRPDAPKLVPGGKSRPFCSELIRQDKLYTRQEIDQISAVIGRDVWRYRGGWYHNPDTDVNTPSCRHEWRQHITVKIK